MDGALRKETEGERKRERWGAVWRRTADDIVWTRSVDGAAHCCARQSEKTIKSMCHCRTERLMTRMLLWAAETARSEPVLGRPRVKHGVSIIRRRCGVLQYSQSVFRHNYVIFCLRAVLPAEARVGYRPTDARLGSV